MSRVRRGSVGLKTIYDHLGLSKERFERLSAGFHEDAQWFHTNISSLREQFSGMYVAVAQREVVAQDGKIENLLHRLREINVDPRLTYVGLVTPRPLDMIQFVGHAMRIVGDARDEGPFVTCGVRTLAGSFGGVVDFLIDTGASYTLLSLIDFRRLGGHLSDIRPTRAVKLTSLSGDIPCHLFGGVLLDFSGDGEATVEMDHIFVPTRELWAPSLLGRDFLRASGWQLCYHPSEAKCELIVVTQ